MWKICRCELWNFANWPTKSGKICRGKLWPLIICSSHLLNDNYDIGEILDTGIDTVAYYAVLGLTVD